MGPTVNLSARLMVSVSLRLPLVPFLPFSSLLFKVFSYVFFLLHIHQVAASKYTAVDDESGTYSHLSSASPSDSYLSLSVNHILVDERTHVLCSAHYRFTPLPAILVKGKTDKVPVFQPLEKIQTASFTRNRLVGRKKELEMLKQRIDSVR